MSPIIEFVNLLHKHSDPNDKEVRLFLSERREDIAFQRRAGILVKLFLLSRKKKENEDAE